MKKLKTFIPALLAAALILASCQNDYNDLGNTDYEDDPAQYVGKTYTTVTFVGRPAAIAPDIRYATFQVHGDKVKGLLWKGKRNGSDSDDYHIDAGGSLQVTFDLPSASTESGVIELSPVTVENTSITYCLTWHRRRYDVRVETIERPAAITSFTFEENADAGENDVKSAEFTVTEPKISLQATVSGSNLTSGSTTIELTKDSSSSYTDEFGNSVVNSTTYKGTSGGTDVEVTLKLKESKAEVKIGETTLTDTTYTLNTAGTEGKLKVGSTEYSFTMAGTVAAKFTLGSGTEVTCDAVALPANNTASGNLEFTSGGTTYTAAWERAGVGTAGATVSQISLPSSDSDSE